MYARMTEIEKGRCQSDHLYDCIVNSDPARLNRICAEIYNIVQNRWNTDTMSPRLLNMLTQTLTSDDRVAKHALIFFALYQEPHLHTFFINESPTVPPEKFTFFVEKELPGTVNKLLRGAFTSLRAFVEDTRWTYTTL
jgi:hypothetical protein